MQRLHGTKSKTLLLPSSRSHSSPLTCFRGACSLPAVTNASKTPSLPPARCATSLCSAPDRRRICCSVAMRCTRTAKHDTWSVLGFFVGFRQQIHSILTSPPDSVVRWITSRARSVRRPSAISPTCSLRWRHTFRCVCARGTNALCECGVDLQMFDVMTLTGQSDAAGMERFHCHCALQRLPQKDRRTVPFLLSQGTDCPLSPPLCIPLTPSVCLPTTSVAHAARTTLIWYQSEKECGSRLLVRPPKISLRMQRQN
jgi:hypothetical protein